MAIREHTPRAPRCFGRAIALGASLALAAPAAAGVARCQRGAQRLESVAGLRATNDLFAGIPQQGIALGDPAAPVTLVEFVDLQCPYCREFALEVLPVLVERYVRPGKLRIELKPLAFIGEDSVEAARLALAMAEQDKMWQLTELFFHNQGEEGSGYANDAFLRRLAAAVPGADVRRAMRDRDSEAVQRELDQARTEADRSGVEGTPAFLLGRTGEALAPLRVEKLTPEAFTKPIDELAGAR